MNWVDVVILVVWLVAAFWGLRSGLLGAVLPLAAVVVGLVLASHLAQPVGDLFTPFADTENVRTIAAFAAIFIVVLGVASLVGALLHAIMSRLFIFGLVDRLAGGAVGVLAGFVLLSGLLTAVQKFPVAGIEESVSDSVLGEFLADRFDVVIRGAKLIPGDWDDKLEKLR